MVSNRKRAEKELEFGLSSCSYRECPLRGNPVEKLEKNRILRPRPGPLQV
jgi:hypothetical protein